ncbi:type II toxin-antitoxin system VapC family toxin [Elioraea sp.]|uniref:type II toxin-antitoxin system VapC family toxin n=1 Tax=Elioraea sp. TaxID=2185103 RepID=UPI003F714D6E
MSAPAGLLDSTVVIACLAEAHEHHAPSLTLLAEGNPRRYAVGAHSYAEAYATLTRTGPPAPFRFTAAEAWAALQSLRAVTALVGLTPAQGFDVVRAYAATDGIGARLYDVLIGQVAVVHGIPLLITWNTRHRTGLFPALTVASPAELLADRPRRR